MNKAQKIVSIALAGLFLVLGSASVAWASDTKVYDWPDEDVPVLVHSDQGLIFIGSEGEPVRAFSWDQTDGRFDRPLRLVDLDGDGSPEIIGSGSPAFVTDSTGVPQFSFEDGCRQVVIADVIRSSDMDLVCVNRQQIRVYTGSGSHAWSMNTGRNVDWCRAGDLTGNTRADLECKYLGRDEYIRVDADSEILATGVEEPNLEEEREDLDLFASADESVWTGGEQFDLDGDGQASETIHAEEGQIEIRKDGEDDALATIEVRGTPQAAVVKDLDGEGAMSIVAVTEHRIYVISDGGETVADFAVDASAYTRVPHLEFDSLRASGFGDEANDEVVEAVKGLKDQMAQCYGSRMRTAPFAGSGRHNMQVMIGADGEANVQQRRSDVDDDEIEACANDALASIDYPPAEEGRALVAANVIFTFLDKEE